MKSILNTAMAVVIAFAITSGAAYAESPNETVFAPEKAMTKAVAVPEGTPVTFKEISGMWISHSSGNSSEFSLKNVKVFEGSLVADVHVSSSFASRCDIREKVVGTYTNNVLQFDVVSVDCNNKSYHIKVSIDTATWKGEYANRRGVGLGWYVVKNVNRAS